MLILKYIDSIPLKEYLKRLCPLGISVLYELLEVVDIPFIINDKKTIFSISKDSLEKRFGKAISNDALNKAINFFLIPGVPLYNINEENLYDLNEGWFLMPMFLSVEHSEESSPIFVTIDNRIMGYFQYLKHLSVKHDIC